MENLRNIYSDLALSQIQRLLSQMDRNPNSSTYGCFDRSYWHYKVSDFANARMQEAALTLALVYLKKYPGNVFYKKEKIKQLAEAGIHFLAKIQNKNGSFNEYYPFENSFVATAFPLYAICEALIELKASPDETVIDCLKKAGDFLMKENDFAVANHQIGAATALHNLYLLTNDVKYRIGAEEKMKAILKLQSSEGWFNEYGGPDFGYLTLAIDYLAKYYKKTGDRDVRNSINRAVDFLVCFIHPDNTIGGEYGSRNTAYVIPHGIEVAAKFSATANGLSKRFLLGFRSGSLLTSQAVDDRFLLYNLYTYLQAYDDYAEKKPIEAEQKGRYFDKSGLVVRRERKYFFVSNLNKGGVFKLFDRKKLIYSDSGFVGELEDGTKITTQVLRRNDVKVENDLISTRGRFYKAEYETMTPLKNVLLRSFLSAGKNSVSGFFKGYLQKKVITGLVPLPIGFERKIEFSNGITISDVVETKLKLRSLYAVDNFSLRYVPSSRFFQKSELNTKQRLCKDLAPEVNLKEVVRIERRINASGTVSIRYL